MSLVPRQNRSQFPIPAELELHPGESPLPASLGAKELHLWSADLDRPILDRPSLECLLSPDERVRADRFRFDRDRDRYIAGRAILRILLGSYLHRAPSEIELRYTAHGKPELAGENDGNLHFNVAHSGPLFVCAFAWMADVGVDVEVIADLPDADELAERYFSAMERTALTAYAEDGRTEAFIRCWTRKEAFLKAIGAGLLHLLDRFDVSLAPGAARLLSIDGDHDAAERWTMYEISPAAGYVGAVAVASRTHSLRQFSWRGDQLEHPNTPLRLSSQGGRLSGSSPRLSGAVGRLR